MFDLITIGDATLDTFVVIDETTPGSRIDKDKKFLQLHYGEKIPIRHTTQSVGGNAANVAVGAERLGLKTAIVTELGDDINGYVVAHELQKANIDTRYVKTIRGAETRYSVVLNYQAERTVLSYYAKRSYTLPDLIGTDWIYYTSLGSSFTKLQTKLQVHLKKHANIRLAMNPGSLQLKSGISAIRSLLPRTEVLFVNKEEAAIVLGKKTSPKAAVKALHAQGVRYVVLTDSTNGSFATDGTSVYSMGIYPVKPLAKTGAGDAYASGFLSALFHAKPLQEAMKWGTANAGAVTTEYGAQRGLLGQRSLHALIRKHKHLEPKKI